MALCARSAFEVVKGRKQGGSAVNRDPNTPAEKPESRVEETGAWSAQVTKNTVCIAISDIDPAVLRSRARRTAMALCARSAFEVVMGKKEGDSAVNCDSYTPAEKPES